jgi:hypothetical protein
MLIGVRGVFDELRVRLFEALALATAGFHHRAVDLVRNPIASGRLL